MTNLIHINQYNTDKQSLEKNFGDVDKEIPDVSGLVTTAVFNIKIGKVESKIPDANCLLTTTALNTNIGEVENKISYVTDSVKMTDYDTKISDIDEKCFASSEHNKSASNIFVARIKEKALIDNSDISNLVKNSNLNSKLAILGRKIGLKVEQGKILQLQISNSSYFRGKSHCEDDRTQNYLVFQPI